MDLVVEEARIPRAENRHSNLTPCSCHIKLHCCSSRVFNVISLAIDSSDGGKTLFPFLILSYLWLKPGGGWALLLFLPIHKLWLTRSTTAGCDSCVWAVMEMDENDTGVIWIEMNGLMLNLGIRVNAKFYEWLLTAKFCWWVLIVVRRWRWN